MAHRGVQSPYPLGALTGEYRPSVDKALPDQAVRRESRRVDRLEKLDPGELANDTAPLGESLALEEIRWPRPESGEAERRRDRPATGVPAVPSIWVMVAIIVAMFWSVWLGIIIALVGLIASAASAKGKWYRRLSLSPSTRRWLVVVAVVQVRHVAVRVHERRVLVSMGVAAG